MRRIVYSPEVQVFVQPGGFGPNGKPLPPVDISNDIVEGSITRKSDDISTAHFVVQNRRISSKAIESADDEDERSIVSQRLLLSNLRPMDRIVVYLKKTKPILVFTGYLDLVPMLQFVPEPVVIEASCTLKRLQFTYWDPTLPSVMNTLMNIGFFPMSAGGNGLDVFQIPVNTPTQGKVQDTGFPKLLQFLLQDVGGWADKDIFIEPIPEDWIRKVEPLFREFQQTDTASRGASEFLSSIVGAAGGGDGGGTDDGGGDTSPIVDEAKVKKFLQDKNAAQWMIDGISMFIRIGNKYKVDPRFLIAITGNETIWGKYEPAVRNHNPGGLGGNSTAKTFSSWEAGVDYMAGPNCISGYKPNTIDGIGAIYCPPKADNDAGQNYKWPDTVKEFFSGMGGNPNADVKGPNYIKSLQQATNRENRNGSGDVSLKASNKDILTIYIEAFDAPVNNSSLRQPGYQDTDILGRNLNDDRSKRRINHNVELASRVTYHLNNLVSKNNLKKNPFDIVLGTDNSRFANAPGYNGDIYLTIDHTDHIYATSSDSDFRDIYRAFAFPANQYSSDLTEKKGGSGSGWSAAGMRKSASGKGIVANSNKLVQSLQKPYTNGSVKGFSSTMSGDGHSVSNVGPFTLPPQTPYRDEAHTFIPGFFYSHTSAAVYLCFPTVTLDGGDPFDVNENSDLKKLFETRAEQIAQGLYLYWKEYKNKNKQQKISSGNVVSSDGTNTNSQNSDTASGKLPWVDPKTAANNPNGVPWDGTGGKGDPVNDAILRILGIIEAKFPGIRPSSTTNHSKNVKNSDRISQHWYGDAVDIQFAAGGPNDKLAKVAQWVYDTGLWKVCDQFILEKSGSGPGRSLFVISKGNIVGNNFAGDHTDHIHFAVSRSNVQSVLTALDDLSDAPVSGSNSGDGTGSGTSGDGSGNSVQDALNAAFNVSFNFPGSLADSLILRGVRALENDVPLLNSVAEVTKASMRTFASLPNGKFIAWYPDYFNLSKRTAWLKISPMELKSCTIDLSDKSLTTHVYILGNTQGLGSNPDAAAASTWLEKLKGSGVVTIEQSNILDSFLGNGFEQYLDILDYRSLPDKNTRTITTKNKQGKKIQRQVSDNLSKSKSAPLAFLERYGARPYLEQNLTIRHPLFEFFYAYHTFIQKWAQQFISKVELTFMPELFPGMIIEIDDPQKRNVTFYVQDVTHNFSYQNGLSLPSFKVL